MDAAVLFRAVVLMLVAYLARLDPGRHAWSPAASVAPTRGPIGCGRHRRHECPPGARSQVGGGRRRRRPPQGRTPRPAGTVRDRRPAGRGPVRRRRRGRAIWSVFAGFRCGRGVGTGVGTMLVIQPVAVLLATPVFVIAILLTRATSRSARCSGSAAMFPAMLLVLLVVPETPLPYVIYSAVGAVVHLARPCRQHRPPAARHGAQVRPRPARRASAPRRGVGAGNRSTRVG